MSHAGDGDGCSLSTYSQGMGYSSTAGDSGTDNLLTPASTPTQTRKSRRRSNLFSGHVSDNIRKWYHFKHHLNTASITIIVLIQDKPTCL